MCTKEVLFFSVKTHKRFMRLQRSVKSTGNLFCTKLSVPVTLLYYRKLTDEAPRGGSTRPLRPFTSVDQCPEGNGFYRFFFPETGFPMAAFGPVAVRSTSYKACLSFTQVVRQLNVISGCSRYKTAFLLTVVIMSQNQLMRSGNIQHFTFLTETSAH